MMCLEGLAPFAKSVRAKLETRKELHLLCTKIFMMLRTQSKTSMVSMWAADI